MESRARIARGSLLKFQQARLHDEDSQHDENARDNVPEAYSVPLEVEGTVCASGSVKSSGEGTVESNTPLDVLIMMPEHSHGWRESKKTKGTTEVELDSCQTGADVHAHISESWHRGRDKQTSSRRPVDHCQQLVEMDSDWLPMVA